jgi:hypothetical protein
MAGRWLLQKVTAQSPTAVVFPSGYLLTAEWLSKSAAYVARAEPYIEQVVSETKSVVLEPRQPFRLPVVLLCRQGTGPRRIAGVR